MQQNGFNETRLVKPNFGAAPPTAPHDENEKNQVDTSPALGGEVAGSFGGAGGAMGAAGGEEGGKGKGGKKKKKGGVVRGEWESYLWEWREREEELYELQKAAPCGFLSPELAARFNRAVLGLGTNEPCRLLSQVSARTCARSPSPSVS